MVGVANKIAGMELRYHIEGGVVGKFHDKGLEYDVRMRLKPEQRDLKSAFRETKVPNTGNPIRMIPLSRIASGVDETGPSKILRQDRSRVIQIYANIAPGGAVGAAMNLTRQILEKDIPMPKGVSYVFVGQADAFEDMVKNIIFAFVLSLIFIYLVLTSLYESFITPVTILMAIPPAMSGAFIAIFITGKLLDMFALIGVVMLLGLVTKNSILLVDFALEGIRGGMSRKEAIANAGRIRLRPILMTTFAMLAGTIPVALGMGEAAKYRTAMGTAIIGGLIVSTVITLVVVPAVFEYVDRFREYVESKFRPEPDNDAELEDKTAKEICDDLRIEEKDCHERLHISQNNGQTVAVMKTEDEGTALKKRKKSAKKRT
jgi:hydrophobic/amphiphilic exporter-1 (mainly G- bacteria), HAE1 family